MTPKELLYIDDALAHAQFLNSQFQDAANSLQDAGLKKDVQNLANTTQQIYQKFYNLV